MPGSSDPYPASLTIALEKVETLRYGENPHQPAARYRRPGSDPADANPYIDVPLATGMGEMRNALIVRAAGAVIAIGGGWGTLSEIALAQRIKTPVVGLHDAFTSTVDIPRVTTPAQAVRWALEQASQRTV